MTPSVILIAVVCWGSRLSHRLKKAQQIEEMDASITAKHSGKKHHHPYAPLLAPGQTQNNADQKIQSTYI